MSTTTNTTESLDSTIRRAFADRDAGALSALYADDAQIELVDVQNQPSSPAVLRGRDAIQAHLADVFSRDITHEIDVIAVGPDALGYSLRCRYADGTRVVCAATAQLANGKIVREVGVQAWDA
jgi:ketosteroid isomerase-like protein